MKKKINKKELIFKNIKIENEKSNLNIFHIDIKINKFYLINTIINGIVNIKNAEVETADFKDSVINGGWVNPVKFKVHNFANMESALFLKNEAYARNNIIDALEYKAKEIEMHKEELKRKNSRNYKDRGDILSIYLSSIYSDNGLNWVKSFSCTILFPIFFFTLSYNFCIPIFTYTFISYTYILFYNKGIEKYIFISMASCIIIFILYINTNIISYTKELFSFIDPTNFSQILYEKGGSSYIYNSKNIL